MDSAHKETDKLIERLEKEITATYTEAQKEVEAKFEKYLESFAEKDKAKLAQVQAGSLSQADYAAWRQSQILVGKRWKDMSNALAQDLANADALSQQIAKSYMLDAYTLNMNYAIQTIGNDASVNTTFTLYNRDAVEKMIKDNPNLLPAMSDETARKIREGKLIKWNEQKITSSVTQSILQGESIDKLAKRLQSVTDMDKRASIRNARTAMTGAENAGRQGAMERATNMGIELERQWVATYDSRTRDWHADLDGQIKPVDEPWENEYGRIMYPADPSAHPANVYNCRCSIRAIVKGFKRNDVAEDESKPETIENAPSDGLNFANGIDDNQKEIVSELFDEYDSHLENINLGAHRSAGDVDITGSTMRLSSHEPTIAVHEFAHTLANTLADKYGLTNNQDFWSEIRKVRTQYRKAVKEDYSKMISTYADADNILDEFMAEAFTQAKAFELGLDMPNKYGDDLTFSSQVLDIVNKYFKRKR